MFESANGNIAGIGTTHVKKELVNQTPNLIEISDTSDEENANERAHSKGAVSKMAVYSLNANSFATADRLILSKMNNTSPNVPSDVNALRIDSPITKRTETNARMRRIACQVTNGADNTQATGSGFSVPLQRLLQWIFAKG